MKKLLLVDDEEPVLALMRATLEDDERYQVLLANNGAEGLEIARREKPDMLFLDIMMPEMDGVEVCRRLKVEPGTSNIKIVMLTALSQESERQAALAAGADDYFTKPFSPTRVLEKVDEMLGVG